MFKFILNNFTLFYSKIKFGCLFQKILSSIKNPIIKDLINNKNQKKAIDLVKELNKFKNLTNKQKAKIFNELFIKWTKTKKINISENIINCLRELAVISLKITNK